MMIGSFRGVGVALARIPEKARTPRAPAANNRLMSALRLQLPWILPAMRTPSGSASQDLADLVARAMRGDRAAFDQVHARLAGGIYRLMLDRTGGRADLAEELAQRAWVVVWEAVSGGKYDPAKSAITTFLYAVGHKIWLQHLRTSSRRGMASHDEGPEPVGVAEDAPDAASLAELLTAVRECMDGGERGVAGALAPDERALIRAVAAGQSDRSLARMLGLAPSTVNVRKRTVMEKIRRFLAVRGHRGPERGAEDGE